MTKKIKTQNAAPALVVDAEIEAIVAETQSIEAQAADDKTLEAAVQAVEAKEDAIAAQANVSKPSSAPGTHVASEAKTLEEAISSISDEDALEAAKEIGANIDTRIEWLKTHKPDNTTQAPKLENYRKKLALPSKARTLKATGADLNFMNRNDIEGSLYNLYAIDKVIDLVNALSGDQMNNAINRAITRTLFAFKREGIVFTAEHARAAASDKIRISDQKIKKILVSHTVSAATAPTQASSTMSALVTLGIVTNTGTKKFPVFVLTDTPATAKLEELVAA